MKAKLFKEEQLGVSMLRVTIESNREKLFWLSLAGAKKADIEAIVNNPDNTHIIVGDEKPFSQSEIQDFMNTLYKAFV